LLFGRFMVDPKRFTPQPKRFGNVIELE